MSILRGSTVSWNPVKNVRFPRSRIFLFVIPSTIFFLDWVPFFLQWQWCSSQEIFYQDIIGTYHGGVRSQFPVKKSYLFIISHQNYLSRHHAIISYLSRLRLPNKITKKFPLPWVYLIPFPAILESTFPISRLKKCCILLPEKSLLGPPYTRNMHILSHIWGYVLTSQTLLVQTSPKNENF